MQYQFVLEEKEAQPTISIRTRTALEKRSIGITSFI